MAISPSYNTADEPEWLCDKHARDKTDFFELPVHCQINALDRMENLKELFPSESNPHNINGGAQGVDEPKHSTEGQPLNLTATRKHDDKKDDAPINRSSIPKDGSGGEFELQYEDKRVWFGKDTGVGVTVMDNNLFIDANIGILPEREEKITDNDLLDYWKRGLEYLINKSSCSSFLQKHMPGVDLLKAFDDVRNGGGFFWANIPGGQAEPKAQKILLQESNKNNKNPDFLIKLILNELVHTSNPERTDGYLAQLFYKNGERHIRIIDGEEIETLPPSEPNMKDFDDKSIFLNAYRKYVHQSSDWAHDKIERNCALTPKELEKIPSK